MLGRGIKTTVGLAAAICVLAFAPTAQGAASWHDGVVEKSQITNCASIIFGSPYQEDGAWTWAGQYFDIANPPDIDEIFYIHVVVGATGNSCSGQLVHLELDPIGSDLFFDISPSHPVYCWAINWNTNPPSAQQEPAYPAGQCPQQTPQQGGGFEGLPFDRQTGPNPGNTAPWPLPQGRGWELQIPVYLHRAADGGFCPSDNDCLKFLTYLLDGNSSPHLHPQQGLFVNNAMAGGGSATNPGTGGTSGNGSGFAPNPQKPPPAAAATTTSTATPPKKCKKNQKLKKGKCVKKKRKKK